MQTVVFDVGTSNPGEGSCPSVPCVSQSTKEDHHSSGLLGSGHNGRQQGRYVIALYTPVPLITYLKQKAEWASSQAKGPLAF